MNQRTISDVEADGLAHVLADRLVTLQHGEASRSPAPQQPSRQTIDKLAGFENISHFRRQFAAQIGVVPGKLRRAVGPRR